MIKGYTDIEQSKTLAEILPIESADLWWNESKDYPEFIKTYHEYLSVSIPPIPCWSLAALLNVLPNGNMLVKTTDGKYYCIVKDIMTKHYDNPIDACYETIKEMFKI